MTQYYLTQKDIDDYGHEMLDVSQRAALQAFAPHLQQTNAQIDALARENADLRAQQASDRRRRLDQDVEKLVPDFQEVDRDPAWHTWLRGTDQMSGRVRQALLNEAIAAGDSRRVKSVFDGFKRSAGQTTSSTTTSPTCAK
jgi:hypothetical protein